MIERKVKILGFVECLRCEGVGKLVTLTGNRVICVYCKGAKELAVIRRNA